jgi:DNA-binding transcriptional regulator YiaG
MGVKDMYTKHEILKIIQTLYDAGLSSDEILKGLKNILTKDREDPTSTVLEYVECEPGDRIEFRKSRGLSQTEIARVLGVSQKTVSNWETTLVTCEDLKKRLPICENI